MRNKLVLCLLSVSIYAFPLLAQKAPLKISSFENWTQLGIRKISTDGRFILYTYGSQGSQQKLVVEDLTGTWRKEIEGVNEADFTENGKFAIFIKSNDTLGIMAPGNHVAEYIPNVSMYKIPNSGGGHWVAYLRNPNRELVVRDLLKGQDLRFESVTDFNFFYDGKALLFQTNQTSNGSPKYALQLLTFEDKKLLTIWEGTSKVENIGMSRTLQQVTFIAEKNKIVNLYYFNPGLEKSQVILSDTSYWSTEQLVLVKRPNLPQFSKDGKIIFFAVKCASVKSDESTKSDQVQLWDSRAAKLKSQQMKEKGGIARTYISAFNLEIKNITQIEQPNEVVLGDINEVHHHTVLLKKTIGDESEYGWNSAGRTTLLLVDTNSGKRKLIKEGLIPIDLMNIRLSPEGRYVVYYDMEFKSYFSYNTQTGTTINITGDIPVPLYDEEHDQPGPARAVGAPVWIKKDAAVLIQDYYDVWKVDPSGQSRPICLTAFYGRNNKTLLRIIEPLLSYPDGMKPKEKIVLAALKEESKETGFFKISVHQSGPPELLTLAPFIYYYPKLSWSVRTAAPIKAKYRDVYLVERMSAIEAPNLFVSKDLIHFKKITDLQPQKEYNWMTAELVRWRMFNDSIAEGLIYKPENFDPHKKYPVIFSVYEKCADELYSFKTPKLSDGGLDIAYFVSNGYLVFTPSIHYTIGEPGPSAYNSIVSGAKYLSAFPWVDSTKMGLQGVSFGGYQVNYIITHSNLFAAAAESAGPADFVSGYGSLRGNGGSYQFIYETSQSRIGFNLWEKPELYIKNSPIFHVDKITTPLLIMHNPNDGQVPFQQAVELFTSLRRLGKHAWMLQYEGEGHGVRKAKNRKDYSMRLADFFDHYLKGKAVPEWMNQ